MCDKGRKTPTKEAFLFAFTVWPSSISQRSSAWRRWLLPEISLTIWSVAGSARASFSSWRTANGSRKSLDRLPSTPRRPQQPGVDKGVPAPSQSDNTPLIPRGLRHDGWCQVEEKTKILGLDQTFSSGKLWAVELNHQISSFNNLF